jgi:hypothetical protein
MKYLSSRTEYLKSAKYKVVNEAVVSGAGPFANDIAWGDSLLGRMLHSFARKAQIGIDLVRIDSVIKRLKTQFDYLVDTAKLNGAEIDEATNKEIDMLRISILLGKLIKAIKEPEAEGKNHLDEIIRVTTETIYGITEVVLYSDESEDDRQEVLEKLNEFLSELKEIEKEPVKKVTPEKPEEKEPNPINGEENETGLTTTYDASGKTAKTKDGVLEPKKAKTILENHKIYMDNIKSIYDVLKSFEKVKKNVLPQETKTSIDNREKEEREEKSSSVGAESFIENPSGKLSKDELIKKKIDEWIESQRKQGKNTKPGEGTRARIRREVEDELNESLIFESSEKSPVIVAVKSLYDYMKSEPDSFDDMGRLVRNYYALTKNPGWRPDMVTKTGRIIVDKGNPKNETQQLHGSSIKSLYDYIKNNSISESRGLDNILSNTKNLGDKIKNLYKACKSGDLSEISNDDLKKSLISFNKTFNVILNEPTTESRIVKTYESFIRNIFEADDTTEPTTEEPTTEDPKTNEDDSDKEKEKRYDLSIPWNKIFSEEYLRKWAVTEQDSKNLEQRLSKMEKEGTAYKINGIDPILEIVKIFNRAYKLHTSQTIPTARSGGKVSNKKFREYEYIGKGTAPGTNDKGSGFKAGMGPYRNIRIFTKWEDAVLDIIKDSKYQVLFNEDTIIQVGKADERVNVSATSIDKDNKTSGRVEGGGKVLLKFMNDLLDGDTLYRSGTSGSGKGAQHQFIEKYFKVDVKENKLDYTGGKEVEENAEVADDTKEDVIVEFKKAKITNKDGCIFNINGSHFMIITASDNNYVYMKYSKSFGFINKYINGENVKGMKGDLPTSLDDNIDTIYYTRMDINLFDNKGFIKIGSDLKLKAINLTTLKEKESELKLEEIEIGVIDDIYTLFIKHDGTDRKLKDGTTTSGSEQYLLPTSATQNAGKGDNITPGKAKGYLEK